jgi:hypothetical protein
MMTRKKAQHIKNDTYEDGLFIPLSPIRNQVTGIETLFGPRRAADGAYVLELLRALGVTNKQADTTHYVLDLLEDYGIFDDTGLSHTLLTLLPAFYEQPKVKAVPRGTPISRGH